MPSFTAETVGLPRTLAKKKAGAPSLERPSLDAERSSLVVDMSNAVEKEPRLVQVSNLIVLYLTQNAVLTTSSVSQAIQSEERRAFLRGDFTNQPNGRRQAMISIEVGRL